MCQVFLAISSQWVRIIVLLMGGGGIIQYNFSCFIQVEFLTNKLWMMALFRATKSLQKDRNILFVSCCLKACIKRFFSEPSNLDILTNLSSLLEILGQSSVKWFLSEPIFFPIIHTKRSNCNTFLKNIVQSVNKVWSAYMSHYSLKF